MPLLTGKFFPSVFFSVPVAVSDTSDCTQSSQPVLIQEGSAGTPVFIVWHDDRSRFTSGCDVFLDRSNTGGVTWGPDQRVVGRMGNQRFPTVSLGLTGKLRVMYRDESATPRQGVQLLRES
ncbi:MAG: hypothetical protein ABI743_05405 [bacterium]